MAYIISFVNQNIVSSKFRNPKLLFIMIIFCYFTLTLLYSLITPTFEGPDEKFHYTKSVQTSNYNFHFIESTNRNPLSYLLIGGLINCLDFFHLDTSNVYLQIDPDFDLNMSNNRFKHGSEEIFPFQGIAQTVHLLRVFSILCGFFTLAFIYKICKLIFPTNYWFSLFVVSTVAFIPRFVWQNSVISDDVLLWTFSTITIFFMLKFAKDPNKLKNLIFMSIFLGLSILSKANGLLLYPPIFVLMFYFLLSKQINLKNFFKKIFFVELISILSGAWIAFRFIPTVITSHVINRTSSDTVSQIIVPIFDNFNAFKWRFFGHNFEAFGKNLSITPPPIIDFAYVLIIISLVGLFLLFINKIKISTLFLNKAQTIILITISLSFILGFLEFFTTNLRGSSRNYYPAIASLSILYSIGMFTIFYHDRKKYLLIIPILFLIFSNIIIIIGMDEFFDHGITMLIPSKIRYDASSQYQASTSIVNAFDSNNVTTWHSAQITPGTPEIITIDFRKPTIYNHVEIISGNMWNPKDFEIVASNDGDNFITIYSIQAEPNWQARTSHDFDFSNTMPYRYYSIKINTAYGSFVEFSEIKFSLNN